MDFVGRVALVTGTGSRQGIGFATALLLGQQGAKIAITSTTGRINDRAHELASQGGEVFAFHADHDRTRVLIEQVLARFGKIDVLVNASTGVNAPGTMLQTGTAVRC